MGNYLIGQWDGTDIITVGNYLKRKRGRETIQKWDRTEIRMVVNYLKKEKRTT